MLKFFGYLFLIGIAIWLFLQASYIIAFLSFIFLLTFIFKLIKLLIKHKENPDEEIDYQVTRYKSDETFDIRKAVAISAAVFVIFTGISSSWTKHKEKNKLKEQQKIEERAKQKEVAEAKKEEEKRKKEIEEQEEAEKEDSQEIQQTETNVENSDAIINPGVVWGTVMSVTDGDTITVGLEGQNYPLRFIGIDTPETKHPEKPVEFMGKEASDFTTNELDGKKVWLEKDVSELDKYNRLLRYVWLVDPSDITNPTYEDIRDKTINGILVREGYAKASTYPPDVKYQEYFSRIEKEAKENNKGLWNESSRQAWESSNPTQQEEANTQQALQSQQTPGGWTQVTREVKSGKRTYIADVTEGPVKGNANSGKYHVQGQQGYNKISVNNVVWFNTEEEAQAAGYVRAKR